MARRILIKQVKLRLDRFNLMLPDHIKVVIERANGKAGLHTFRWNGSKWEGGRTLRAGMTLRETFDYLVAMEEGIELFKDQNNKV